MRLIGKDVDPYTTEGRVIQENEAGYNAYYDGWHQGKHDTSYQDALESLFMFYGAGGYPLSYYVDDGDYLEGPFCNECAAPMWEDGAEIVVEHGDNDNTLENGVFCEKCGREIDEQKCIVCYDRLYSGVPYGTLDLPFMGSHGYYAMHARCLADLVLKGEATKIGLCRYQVNNSRHGGEYYAERCIQKGA